MIAYKKKERVAVEYFTLFLYTVQSCPEGNFEFGTYDEAEEFLNAALLSGVTYSMDDRFSRTHDVYVRREAVLGGTIRKEVVGG